MNPTSSLTDLTATCGTCGGSGSEFTGTHLPSDMNLGPSPTDRIEISNPCPDCDGRGWVLDLDRREAAAWAIVTLDLPSHFVKIAKREVMAKAREAATVAVLAYLEPPT